MAKIKYLLLLLIVLLNACKNKPSQSNNTPLPAISPDTVYMKTGFYFLADSADAVRMRKDHTDDIFFIAKTPFASVDNIIKSDTTQKIIEGRPYTDLMIKFDAQGTKDLEEGTSNALQPRIALVIGSRLIYVVENGAHITTGVVYIVLENYTKDEIIAMKKDIEQKR
jgi:hypothetical protein